MNFLKDLFNNLEMLISSLILFDYSKLILILLIFVILFIIHLIFIKRNFRKNIKNTNIELKKINIEASYLAKRKKLAFFYTYGFFILGFLFITKDNLNIVLPVLTGFTIILIFSLKEQLNNIFLGILFKSAITTTIYEGMEFYEKGKPNEFFKIIKINLFKSILKNEKTGQIESIENKELNSLHIIHKALKGLDYVSFKYVVLNDFNFKEYIKFVDNFFKEKTSITEVNFNSLKGEIFDIKEKYNSAPYLKPFYDLDINMKNKDETEITIFLTLYNYNYENYLNDYLKLKP